MEKILSSMLGFVNLIGMILGMQKCHGSHQLKILTMPLISSKFQLHEEPLFPSLSKTKICFKGFDLSSSALSMIELLNMIIFNHSPNLVKVTFFLILLSKVKCTLVCLVSNG